MSVVSCNVMGGLGNQLFQIITCISYGIDNNKKIIIPYDNESYGVTSRKTYWDSLLKPFVIFTNIPNVNKIPVNLQYYTEPRFAYDNIDLYSDSVYLKGYFQSYRYFDNNIQKILRMLRMDNIKQQVYEENKSYFQGVTNDTCAIHFRLGDYTHLQDYHPLLNVDYYISALTNLCETKNISRVLYFCQEQDNEIVEKHIETIQSKFMHIVFIKTNDNICDWKQMILMTLCNHHIIANSTFSWWGAYLSSHSHKKVLYPSIWFGNKLKHNHTEDLFPCEWEKIIITQ